MRAARRELHRLGQRRRALLIQSAIMVGSSCVLVFGAGALDGAPIDLQFLYLAATGLFSLAAIQLVDELCTILGSECPCCAGRFFGMAPESLPSPLRRRCSDCGAALSEPSAESGGAPRDPA